jgi:hypothetical protein
MGLSYPVVSKASKGDVAAIGQVLLYYDDYISKSSLRPVCDDCGNTHMEVDMELKGNIITALIQMILKFEMNVV